MFIFMFYVYEIKINIYIYMHGSFSETWQIDLISKVCPRTYYAVRLHEDISLFTGQQLQQNLLTDLELEAFLNELFDKCEFQIIDN